MRQVLFLSLLLSLFAARLAAQDNFHFPGVHAIYGVDDRELITNKTAPKYREMARSVALIVSSDIVTTGLFKTAISAETIGKNFGMCETERFNNEMSLSGCTGFLVGEDLLISAGHCFESASDCENKKIIFDVLAKKQTANGYSVFSKDVYSCKEIIANQSGGEEDFALIRLGKKVRGRPILKLRQSGKVADDDLVFMLGHPMGMPMTLSKTQRVKNNQNPSLFTAELDSFVGNSGSPVINAKTLEVEGILVGGQQDLVLDSQKQCYLNAKHESGAESITRISLLSDFLKN